MTIGRIFGFLAAVAATAFVRAETAEHFIGYRHGFNRDVMALQILLDRQNFSCNCVDGVWGKRSEIALMTWQMVNGKPPTGIPTDEILNELGGTNDLYSVQIVTTNDVNALVTIPPEWENRAKLKSMGYESLQEMFAERGHTSFRGIERLNPNVAWPNPPVGTAITVPNCVCTIPAKRLKAASVRIALTRMEISAFDANDVMIALFPCSIAKDKSKRPDGELKIKAVAPNPTYTFNPQMYYPGTKERTKYIIPAGPNNPVGVAWVGLNLEGYGIHGTPQPEMIGQAASHGCFRLANWNAEKLLKMIQMDSYIWVEE